MLMLPDQALTSELTRARAASLEETPHMRDQGRGHVDRPRTILGIMSTKMCLYSRIFHTEFHTDDEDFRSLLV